MSWPIVKLGDLVSIKGGGTPSKKVDEYWSGDIPWASVKDLKSRELSTTEDTITPLGVQKSATNVVPRGTIIVPTRMALGKVAITACEMAINQDLKAIFINDEEVLNKAFFMRFLESKAKYIEGEGKGATVKGITLDFLKNLDVPLPPIDEQKRIAAILDKVDDIRQKRKQAIALADDFLRSVFLDMFGDPVTNPKGWEVKRVSDLCHVSSGATPSRKKPEYYGGNVPWVKTTEVDGYVIEETEEYITSEALNESSCKLNPKGSLVIAMYGQGKTRGKVGILGVEAATNQACAVLAPSDNVNMDYLYCYLKFSYDQLRALGQGGGQPNLNGAIVKGFPVMFPPRELQDSFVEKVKLIESEQKRSAESMSNVVMLFSSLSSKAFSGQL